MLAVFRERVYTKKLVISRQPTLINLKSNTMKNTMQSYERFLKPQRNYQENGVY